jgi:hypothetical protein
MNVPHPISLVNAGTRAALVLMALVGTANLAIGMAFTPSTIQARVAEVVRRAPSPVAFDKRADVATASRLSSHQR